MPVSHAHTNTSESNWMLIENSKYISNTHRKAQHSIRKPLLTAPTSFELTLEM